MLMHVAVRAPSVLRPRDIREVLMVLYPYLRVLRSIRYQVPGMIVQTRVEIGGRAVVRHPRHEPKAKCSPPPRAPGGSSEIIGHMLAYA